MLLTMGRPWPFEPYLGSQFPTQGVPKASTVSAPMLYVTRVFYIRLNLSLLSPAQRPSESPIEVPAITVPAHHVFHLYEAQVVRIDLNNYLPGRTRLCLCLIHHGVSALAFIGPQ